MDEDSLRNWGYYEPDKGHGNPLGFQLMSSVAEQETKPFLSGRDNHPVMVPSNSPYRPRVVTEPPITRMDFVRDSWINNRDKFLHMFPGNSQNPYTHPTLPESSGPRQHPMQMIHHHHHHQQQQSDSPKETPRLDLEEEPVTTVKKEPGSAKKRASAPKTPKGKKPRKGPGPKENGNSNSNNSASSVQRAKRNVEVVINGVDMDITGIPIPVCSCTGTPQQCYRWGCGGWQSACCTTTISMYPLPMSTKRRGARIAGRKMSQGAFKKVLEKLASEGYDFGNSPIDLRTYWAKHGTNKFVIIR